MICGDLKKTKTLGGFNHHMVVVVCQHTFMFKQHVKVNFTSDCPL